MNRRTFLGGVAGAALLPVLPLQASPDETLSAEEIAKWKGALFDQGEPPVYRALAQPQAAFPTGGIGCGNVYVGSGGHLRDWLIFNNTAPVQVPNCFFAVRAAAAGREPVARMLQTESIGLHVIGNVGSSYQAGTSRVAAPGPGVRDVELRGDYPIARLRYLDPALPVEVELETFTPWVPLDAQHSGMPATVFLFHVRNPHPSEAKVSLLAAFHNAAGLGEPGGNFNQAWRRDGVSGVRMGIRPGSLPRLDRSAELVAAVPGFRLPEVERPENLTVRSVSPASPRAEDLPGDSQSTSKSKSKSKSGNTILWLEDVETLTAAAAAALRKAVEGGATLVVSGSGGGLLGSWGGALNRTAADRPDIRFEDFESGAYDKWEAQGTAFGPRPQTGTLANQQPVSGFRGKFLVNSFTDGDRPTGRLTSQPFQIERRYLRFLIGGGDHPDRTCINLLVDGKTVRTATGKNLERLEPHAWDVSDLQGRSARLEIVDEETGGWGHVNIDEIVFSDRPGAVLPEDVARELSTLLPVAYDHAAAAPGAVSVSLSGPDQAARELRLPARLRLEGARAQPDSDVLARAGEDPVLWARRVGKGRVLLLAAPLFPAQERGSRAARERALMLLAYGAGLSYQPGQGMHPKHPAYGELCIAASAERATGMLTWDDPAKLWEAFAAGRLPALRSGSPSAPTSSGQSTNAAMAVEVTVPPNGEVTVPVVLAWHFPNYYFQGTWVGNQYPRSWKDSTETAVALSREWSRHRQKTDQYRKTAYETTLPYWMVDCLTSQSSTIRSEVCVWLDDGTFAGYEGADGCCPMNCSHVWGYEQSLARLFPELEKRMRETDFKHQQRADGGINNRVVLPVQPGPTGEVPFTDGHASGVLKAYREHLNSPDKAWLQEYWPNIRKAVDYLVGLDGAPPDGVIEGPQPNTYDCTVFGPNTFIGSYYLAALRAGEEMARLVGEEETALRWHEIFRSGQRRLVELCWNGEYYTQNLPDYTSRATQWGPGCLADQLIGQWWAHQLRLGYVLPKEQVRSALRAVFKHNWLWDFSTFRHRQRVFADRHDKGLLNCTWPRGGRPNNPILYCDEVWTGVEYQVAGHMVYEGMMEEAFTIVRGARERYDGRRRNPWNEIECGGHYARAMANWSLLLALSGFYHDGPQGVVAFDPVFKPESYRSLFTTAEAWGSFSQERTPGRQRNELRLDHGRLRLRELHLGLQAVPQTVTLRLGNRRLTATPRFESGTLRLLLPQERTLSSGDTLTIEFG